MIIRIVRMVFRPEALEAFELIWQESKEHIRAMPGCLSADMYRDHSKDNARYTISHWQAPDDLEGYRQSALFGQVWPKTKALFAEKAQAYSLVAAQ